MVMESSYALLQQLFPTCSLVSTWIFIFCDFPGWSNFSHLLTPYGGLQPQKLFWVHFYKNELEPISANLSGRLFIAHWGVSTNNIYWPQLVLQPTPLYTPIFTLDNLHFPWPPNLPLGFSLSKKEPSVYWLHSIRRSTQILSADKHIAHSDHNVQCCAKYLDSN